MCVQELGPPIVVVCLFVCLIGCLVGCLVGWLAGLLMLPLVSWFVVFTLPESFLLDAIPLKISVWNLKFMKVWFRCFPFSKNR